MNQNKNLLISHQALELCLEKRRNEIGTNAFCWSELLSAIIIFVGALGTSYTDFFFIPAYVIKYIAIGFSLVLVGLFVYQVTRRFNKEVLLKEIEDLNMIERSSSIVAIKNNANPRKYLLYHDNGWNVDFFPNFTNYKKNSDTEIKHKLSEALGIKEDQIDIKLTTSGTEEKPSTEHNNETRRYFYDIYYATISDFEYTLSSSFNIDGREYKWLTFDEMLADEAIQKNNSYLVKLVKDNTI